ncbi:MAG: type pilus assembly protein PilO [Clostridiales bacterium]|jgi:type II secretory pathway component PulM|nr:type pilus assembly protein PilO [Clostridiales bacterium]MDK2934336.1 type pilus assembly protein PilO [Clostridiales bacterium]
MTLSDKDKKVLIALILLGIFASVYFFIYSPLYAKLNTLRREVQKLQNDLNIMQGIAVQKNQFDNRLEVLHDELEKLNKKIPPDLLQENIILILKDIQLSTGVHLKNLTFTEIIPVISDSSNPQQVKSEQNEGQNQLILNKINNDNKKNQHSGLEIPDETGIKMEVHASYTATYSEIKNFLAAVINNESKITVKSITLTREKENTLTGNLILEFYGFKNNAYKQTDWHTDVTTGKSELFESFEDNIQ